MITQLKLHKHIDGMPRVGTRYKFDRREGRNIVVRWDSRYNVANTHYLLTPIIIKEYFTVLK